MNNWQGIKNGMNLSQKFLDKIKPEYALKNRINGAEKQMESQITRLDQAHNKLKQNHDNIFKKIVEAKLTRDESKARTYAIELQEIRKIKNKIAEAKLAMEQIKLRLGTVSELGDIVVTLSPCMSLIKGLSTSLGDMMPSAAASMQDLSNMLGDIVSGSSVTHDGTVGITEATSSDALSILKEAEAVVEGNIRSSMPEPPVTTIDSILAEKENPI